MGPSANPSVRRLRTKSFGWQWRRNALRRRTDVIEAILTLLTVVALCLVPVFGWWAGHSVDRALQRVVRTQRSERFLVSASVLPKASAPTASTAATSSASRPADQRRGDVLRWTGPDRSVHTTTVSVDLEVWKRGRILLWTDSSGRLAPPPLDSATATTHAVLAGTAAATSAGGLVLITRQVLMWRLLRRRLDSWEREWARVGQDWGRTGAGG